MKTYIIFGQNHVHEINGKTFDKDCVAVIKAENISDGRKLAFKYFGPRFCFTYTKEQFDFSSMYYFHRGIIPVNF